MKYEFSFFKWFSTVRSWCPFILIDVLQENGRIRMYNNALKVLLQLLWSLLGYTSTWGWFGAHQTHKDSHKPKYLCTIDSAWINGWDYSLVGVSGKQGSTTHIFTRCWSSLWWVEEQNTHNTTREKRGRRRRRSTQIWWLWTDLIQVSDWRLKHAWICTKLSELILHLEYSLRPKIITSIEFKSCPIKVATLT